MAITTALVANNVVEFLFHLANNINNNTSVANWDREDLPYAQLRCRIRIYAYGRGGDDRDRTMRNLHTC